MKLALPPRKDCRYIRQKLKVFWNANINSKFSPTEETKQLDRALIRLCHFFQLPKPSIKWFQNLNNFFTSNETKVLGQCEPDGQINLLTPYYHGENFEGWLDTFYHEIGHYVLWADCEKKAREFASKMRCR